mmetsp:Transcript_19128/g.32870  ORF Transcript_19128/g.32870 Transcript_19128/m.32870 type:complete len:135 (+) Transcript_19128:105-509(+)
MSEKHTQGGPRRRGVRGQQCGASKHRMPAEGPDQGQRARDEGQWARDEGLMLLKQTVCVVKHWSGVETLQEQTDSNWEQSQGGFNACSAQGFQETVEMFSEKIVVFQPWIRGCVMGVAPGTIHYTSSLRVQWFL